VLGDLGMVAHHLVSLATVAYALGQPCGHMYMMWVLFSEVTTPFINLKFLLEYWGMKSSIWYGINGLIILLGWLAGRIYLFGAYFAHVYKHRRETSVLSYAGLFVLLVLPTIISALNLLWFWKIVRGVLKFFVGPKKKAGAAGTAAAAATPGKKGTAAAAAAKTPNGTKKKN
jgi:hypothetical protein